MGMHSVCGQAPGCQDRDGVDVGHDDRGRDGRNADVGEQPPCGGDEEGRMTA